MLDNSRVSFLNGILNCNERAKGAFTFSGLCVVVQSCGDCKFKERLFSEAGGIDGLHEVASNSLP